MLGHRKCPEEAAEAVEEAPPCDTQDSGVSGQPDATPVQSNTVLTHPFTSQSVLSESVGVNISSSEVGI